MYDIFVKNGRIIDGTGNPWFYGDIGIAEDKIAFIGKSQEDVEAKEIIDATGKYVTPGFIDLHTHSDFTILPNPLGESKIRQGITTEVGGNCGFSLGPVECKYLDQLKKFVAFMPVELSWDWKDIGGFLDKIKAQGTSVNFGTLVGQGVLRIAAMGFENRVAQKRELEKMKYDLQTALDQGALGLSVGLVYAPGSYAPIDELLELVKIVAKNDKIFTAHVRNEGERVEESIGEVLSIAEATGVNLHISHLKATGQDNWPKMDRIIEMIEKTRAKGIDVTFDVYAYNALNTLLTALLPGWGQEGGVEAIVRRIEDKSSKRALMEELEKENLKYGGWQNIMVASVKYDQNKWAEGKTIMQIAEEQGKVPAEAMLDLLHDDECSIMVVCFSMDDENVIKALKHPLSMLGSDGKSLSTEGKLAAGRPHPRNYGAFPRFIAKYVRDKGIMPLEEAIRKMTSAPAQKIKKRRRGILREGFYADVVIFDYEKIEDKATFIKPQQYPEGIDCIIVNGKITISNGQHTGALAGQIIT